MTFGESFPQPAPYFLVSEMGGGKNEGAKGFSSLPTVNCCCYCCFTSLDWNVCSRPLTKAKCHLGWQWHHLESQTCAAWKTCGSYALNSQVPGHKFPSFLSLPGYWFQIPWIQSIPLYAHPPTGLSESILDLILQGCSQKMLPSQFTSVAPILILSHPFWF